MCLAISCGPLAAVLCCSVRILFSSLRVSVQPLDWNSVVMELIATNDWTIRKVPPHILQVNRWQMPSFCHLVSIAYRSRLIHGLEEGRMFGKKSEMNALMLRWNINSIHSFHTIDVAAFLIFWYRWGEGQISEWQRYGFCIILEQCHSVHITEYRTRLTGYCLVA